MMEPTTTITDFILAGMSFYFGHMLFHKHSKALGKNVLDRRFNQFWAITFLFLGIGSLLGGLAHGFPHLRTQYFVLAKAWPFTVLSLGLVSFYLLLALSMEYFPRWRNILFFVAYFKMMFFMLLLFGYPKKYFGEFLTVDFKLVIYDYAPVLLLLFIMNLIDFIKTKSVAAKTMVIGVGLSIIGTLVQMSGFKIHQHFNHNDIYHVIQMAAIYLMYKSVTLKKLLC